MSDMNRMANCKNNCQGKSKRVLCVCSGGLLRSPTAAWVLSNPPYNYNTRSAGISEDFSLIVVDGVLFHWADEIVCMEKYQYTEIRDRTDKPIKVLGIPDKYNRMDTELISKIREAYGEP